MERDGEKGNQIQITTLNDTTKLMIRYGTESFTLPEKRFSGKFSKKERFFIPRSSTSSNSSGSKDDRSDQTKAQDTIWIYKERCPINWAWSHFPWHWLKKWIRVDPLQAGNVVQLVLVLGLTIGWISTYIFRVSNKEMTYAQQLRDYESKVMEKRLESLTEAELQALIAEVEEEKSR
ncbi:hypothetical protein SESBI_34348 [Sesbania bispinosa]|nr:hypothetical protein SESBI_34348 [Sesbania bispinosa]